MLRALCLLFGRSYFFPTFSVICVPIRSASDLKGMGRTIESCCVFHTIWAQHAQGLFSKWRFIKQVLSRRGEILEGPESCSFALLLEVQVPILPDLQVILAKSKLRWLLSLLGNLCQHPGKSGSACAVCSLSPTSQWHF